MATGDRRTGGPMDFGRIPTAINGTTESQRIKMMRLLGARQDKDERAYPRVSKLMVVDYSDQHRAFRDFTRDISAGGMFIETKQFFNTGQPITLAFSFEESSVPVRMQGTVIRTTPGGIGVEFKWFEGMTV